MGRNFFVDFVARFRGRREPRPLVTRDHDVRLLRRITGRRWPSWQQFRQTRRILSPTEQRWFNLSLLVLTVGVLWSGFVVIGRYRVAVPAVGGRYVEGTVGSPQLINPLFAGVNDVDGDLSRLIYSGLMRYDERQRLVLDLAVTTTIGADKKTYLVELRRDVRWHDGQPFTARDVVFTMEALTDSRVGSPLFVTFQGVKAEVVDDYHVRFVLPEAFAPFLATLTFGILPEHIWGEVPLERLRLHKKNLEPIGTGPYQFKKFVKDEGGYVYRYQLARFADYYRSGPYIEEFIFQFFSSYDGDDGAIQALRAGRVDGLSFVPNELAGRVERKHLVVRTVQLPQYTALFFNKDHQSILGAVEVRTALGQALDKNQLLRDALHGEGAVIHSPILPGYPGYDPEAGKIAYAVEQANQALDKVSTRVSTDEFRAGRRATLLKELGGEAATSTDNPALEALVNREINPAQTFYRKSKDGNLYVLSLVTADAPEYRRVAELVAGFWQEVGVKTNLRFVGTKDFSRDVLKNRDYDVLLYGAIVGSDPDQYPLWHSSQVDFPGLNLARYVNRAADGLLEKARVAANEEERLAAYTQFQSILAADRPAIFLYTPTYRYATTDNIHGINITRVFHPSDRFADVTNWYIKTRGQWRR